MFFRALFRKMTKLGEKMSFDIFEKKEIQSQSIYLKITNNLNNVLKFKNL